MERLSPQDAAFLHAETPSAPMNIAVAQHLALPAGTSPSEFFLALRQHLAAHLDRVPFLTRRPEPMPLGFDRPVWVQDRAFDLSCHLHRIALPAPGTPADLEALLGWLHEQPLRGRHRPLWNIWLIEGLESGHVVLYSKFHHSCIDGVAGQVLLDLLYSDTPLPMTAPPGPRLPPERPPNRLDLLRDSAAHVTGEALRSLNRLPALLSAGPRLAARCWDGSLGTFARRAPPTPFNVVVGPERSCALGSLSLSSMKALGGPLDCTVNDVWLAVCAGGLKRYLGGLIPEQPLIAGAPVSFHDAAETGLRNRLGGTLVSLATHRQDPIERLLAIRDSARVGKDAARRLAGTGIGALLAPVLPLAVAGLATAWDRFALGDRLPLPLNLVISDIPGPPHAKFLVGARMLTHYPLSAVTQGLALIITGQSYQNRMDFGLTACSRAVPDIARLRDAMLAAFAELELAAGGGSSTPPAVDPVPNHETPDAAGLLEGGDSAVGSESSATATGRKGATAMLYPNWADLFEAIAALDPDAEAIVQGDRRMTWGDFDDRAARAAAVFDSWGLTTGARVALLLFNCPEYLELAYGAFKARVVTHNVNFRYRTEELRYLLEDSGADALVFHGALAEQVAGLGDAAPRHLVQIDDGEAPLLDGACWYEDLLRDAEPAPPVPRSGDDLLMLYTGGTTGMPKGVLWRHGDLFQALSFPAYTAAGMTVPDSVPGVVEATAALREAGAAPVMISAPPLIHGTALFLALSVLLRGGKVVLLRNRRFDALELWRLVERERVTDLAIVGDSFARPMIHALEERTLAGDSTDLSSLRVISSAGVTWSHETKSALRRHGDMLLLDMLGASEGGPFAVSMTLPGETPSTTATFRIAEGVVLIDDEDRTIPPGSGRVGRLALRGIGPLGYFNAPEKTAETFRMIDGERHVVPGDYASVAHDGTVTFVGRGSVCINTGGEKVFPEEVEEVLKTHPAVVDCNVVGIPDEQFGEALTAVVQLTADEAVSDAELVAHVKARLAGYKQPRHIARVAELMRSPTGKSDYRAALATARAVLGLD